jgi:alcohol dehydrogenase
MHAFAEPLTVEQVRDPDVPGDGVVIEARATGLCRSDWHVWMGHDPSIRLPHVPGHELAGVVATAQSAARRPGDGPVLLRQRRCEPCRQGHTQGCDVAYSPASAHRALRRAGGDPRCRPQLRPPSNGVDFDEAAALGCRFMTACAAVAVRGRVRPGDWLAVHRCGGVGLLAVMLGKALGAASVAIDIDQRALALALGARGHARHRRAHRRPGTPSHRADRRRGARLDRRNR